MFRLAMLSYKQRTNCKVLIELLYKLNKYERQIFETTYSVI